MGLSRRLRADLWLAALALVWGATFVIVKSALADSAPLLFVGLRFTLAAIVLAPVLAAAPSAARNATALAGGLVTGTLLFAGYALQTLGLERTTPSRSAFITGTAVVFTPLISVILRIRRPSPTSVAGAILATWGLYLLTRPAGGPGIGDGLTLGCAICFAGHLIAIDHWTRRAHPGVIATGQVALTGLLGLLTAFTLEPIGLGEVRFTPTPRLIVAIAVTALLATALALWIQTTVQAWTTPTRAAIILALEPVFAALTSWLFEGEILGRGGIAGAALILAGMIVAEWRPPREARSVP